jgi:general secretion pathway protein E/type IV pilus assembly protein PilB
VFSTLHTNDACSATTRLLDMGIEPYLVNSTLGAAMAQRLVRTVCPHCKTAYVPDRTSLPEDFHLEEGQTLFRGSGCRKCRDSGYLGRAGLFELMVVNDAIRDRVIRRSSAGDILEAARQTGLRLLREDGWDKVRQGLTTPEEVIRCTKL